jgi:hypothetical protein
VAAPAPMPKGVEFDIDTDADAEPDSEMQEIELTEEVIEPPSAPVGPPAPVGASVVPGPPVPQAPRAPPATPIPTASPAARVPAAASTRAAADQLFDRSGLNLSGRSAVGSAFIDGEHRVIVHTIEGQVKRGVVRDVDLLDSVIPLELQSGTERIPAGRVKAIFFMTTSGARQPAPSGQKIRVTFGDGRQIAGYSTDFRGSEAGFFLVPADNRTNTARIYVFRSSVQSVSPA